MAVYLVSSEPRGRTLQHSEEPSAGVVLCTKEYADEHTLMHYRVGGEKTGVRRWQNKNGSYTRAGYEHYAEMYGWGKFRADRAEKKAAKYEDKAKKAEAELHKQQVKADKAQVKVDRKGNEKDIQKSQAATNKLHEAQLRFDQYRNKAEKYQSKTDRLHDKWDEQTKKLEEKAETARKSEAEMRYWKQKTEAEGKGPGEAHANYEKLEKQFAALAEKTEQELQKRGIKPDTSTDFDSAAKAEREAEERAAEERVENNRYVEGSRAFRENAENERRMQDFDNLSAEDKRKTGDYLLKKMSDFNDVYKYGYGEIANAKELDDLDADVAKQAVEEYNRDYSWIFTQIDRVAGNENTGEYVEGSNSEKAHQRLMKSYDESWARREELEREAGIDLTQSKNYERDHQRLKEILDSDKIYKALNEVDVKNENDLITAVLKDLGFSNTPTNRSMIFPIVFRD